MLLALALLALGGQPAAAAPPPAVPPTAASSTVRAPADAPVADAAGDDIATSLAGLQQVYDQSCAAREYGAYDDLCDQLRQQLRAARAEATRQARRQAAAARHPPRPQPPIAPQPRTTAPLASPS